jgi:CheY-like chemotaxis protein
MDPLAPLVLVVDDSSESSEAFQETFSCAGYRVAIATRGDDGLRLAERLQPDMVLLDMVMPSMDGLEFLERLPFTCKERTPPVLANSGSDAFERSALLRGARAFVRKPVSAECLLAVTSAVLGGAVQRMGPDVSA